MNHFGELLLGLMVAVAALSTIARLIDVPYPILLVVGGLVLGLIPGLPDVQLDPDLVLVLFLPPLLYAAAFFSSLRDLRRSLRPISMLAIGLVLATAGAVALVAHELIDGMPWAAAFALGGILAPTDPLASSAIIRRLGAPRRVVTIIEGESLINDGTALVIYRAAVVAAVGGGFTLLDGGLDFVVGAAGGVAVGLVVGWLVARIRKPLEDPPVEITISLATAYAAYLPAESIGLSGVLAAVTAGIYLGWQAPKIASPNMRIQGRPVWETLVFLLNALLFVLVGLQLPVAVGGLGDIGAATLAGYAAAICATVVGVRLLWLNVVPLSAALLERSRGRDPPGQILGRADRDRLVRDAGRRLAGGGPGAAAEDRQRCALSEARPDHLPRLLGDPLHPGGRRPYPADADAPGGGL